jgi:hypothetical protein
MDRISYKKITNIMMILMMMMMMMITKIITEA